MTTLQKVLAVIPQLTLEERAEVARFLHGWQDDAWDRQIKRDLGGPKLKKLLKKADIAGGELTERSSNSRAVAARPV
jgi:ribosome recycling factor